jgi:hypothetical protein
LPADIEREAHMGAWPGNPVATMIVESYHGGTGASISLNGLAVQHEVTDATIEFAIEVAFHDHPYWDNGRGYFRARLDKLDIGTGVWSTVQTADKSLGNNNDDGDWYDALMLSVTMTDLVEQYRIALHCETKSTTLGSDVDHEVYLQAVQGQSAIGDFTLDFVPLSIVYCPPGQDMTASLTQSESYGTRFTIGQSSGIESQSGQQAKIDFLGIFGEGIGFSQSQTVSNQSTSGVQLSHFRNTVITADNRSAIGRAYWGPLGDIFVILVNPTFAASRRADGTILYALKGIQQVLAIPAWKLLRPGGDPIASVVPADVRRRLLELDPLIRHLDLFFPDSGADLAKAANPFADPSANNRAELIGRWWLDTGTALNYSMGDSRQLFSSQANEVKFSSTVSINANLGADINGLKLGLGLSQSNTTRVGFQTSKETTDTLSTTAACYLIHNQNERDLDGIEIYYDKIFSTFIFRRIRARRWPGDEACTGSISGTVRDSRGTPMRQVGVRIEGADGHEQVTITSPKGEYQFGNLCPGKFTLSAGDKKVGVSVTKDHSGLEPARADLDGVRRVLDLAEAPVWEVREALGLSSEAVRKIGADVGARREQEAQWDKRVVLNFPRVPRPPRSKGGMKKK